MKPVDCLPLYADAHFYDAEFKERDFELPFYRWLCANHPGPVLEIACGTGRLTLPLAELGHDITGVDVSPEMLQLAQHKAPQLPWQLQDCRTLRLDRKFGTIFMATNALQHVHDAREIELTLVRVREHLAPKGIFALDVFNPNPQKLKRPITTRYLHKTFVWQGNLVEVYAQSEYREQERILHFDLSYCRDGTEFKTKSVNMRCLFPPELTRLCEAAGLKIIHRFGKYDRSPFTSASPKQILLCTPANPASSQTPSSPVLLTRPSL